MEFVSSTHIAPGELHGYYNVCTLNMLPNILCHPICLQLGRQEQLGIIQMKLALKQIAPSCLAHCTGFIHPFMLIFIHSVPLEIVVWVHDTFDNILGI